MLRSRRGLRRRPGSRRAARRRARTGRAPSRPARPARPRSGRDRCAGRRSPRGANAAARPTATTAATTARRGRFWTRRATPTPTSAAQIGRPNMRWRGESRWISSSSERASTIRIGTAASARSVNTANAGRFWNTTKRPTSARPKNTSASTPSPPANASSASPSWRAAKSGGATLPPAEAPTPNRSPSRRSATTNGVSATTSTSTGMAGLNGRPRQSQSPIAGLDPGDDEPVRVHRGEEPRGDGGQVDGARRPLVERAGEEIDGDRAREREERVHAPDRPVDGQHRRGSGDDRGDRSRPCAR